MPRQGWKKRKLIGCAPTIRAGSQNHFTSNSLRATTMKLLQLFLLGLILTALLISPTFGYESDEDDRDVEISQDDDFQIEIESVSRKDGVKSKLEFSIDVSDGKFQFELEYKKESNQVEAEREYSVDIERLIEYNETNNIPGYQPGEEVVVYDLNNGDLDWNRIDCTPLDNQINCTISTVNGYFTAVVRIAGSKSKQKLSTPLAIVPLTDELLRPTSAKVDIIVQKTAGTHFALVMKLKSEEEQEYREESSEQSEGFSQKDQHEISFAGDAFFSWDVFAR